MKSFNTNNNGGLKIYLDDFRFMESIHKDAFLALVSPYANIPVVILNGCERTVDNGTVTISAGWVIRNGEEICRVPEHNYPDSGDLNNERWMENNLVLAQRSFEGNPSAPTDIYTEKTMQVSNLPSGFKYADTKTRAYLDVDSKIATFKSDYGIISPIPWTALPGSKYADPQSESAPCTQGILLVIIICAEVGI